MCGIAGYAEFKGLRSDPSVLTNMCDVIEHRGPDHEGLGRYGSVQMGMRRLSILDVDGGNQPFANDDESICLTYNGEIYNFKELRSSLISRGINFETDCDTEVLLRGYEVFGTDILNQLRGMFAFSLLDKRKNQVLLVRDQVGIKPLYYANMQNAIVWGSEVKCLLAHPSLTRTLDKSALNEFLRWEYVPGDATLFSEIKKVEPGSIITIDLAQATLATHRYWKVENKRENDALSAEEHLEETNHLIASAVKRQLVSDVPLGAFLSGGVDSSLVASYMGDAQTFSIGFDDPSYNELEYAAQVAEALNLKHEIEILDSNVVQYFDRLIEHYDDPIADFSIFPTYLVSKLAKKDVTVALSGDGGDELFAGYDTHVAQMLASKLEFLPTPARRVFFDLFASKLPPQQQKKGLINKISRFAEGFAMHPRQGHARWRNFASDKSLAALLTPDFLALETADQHISNLYSECTNLDAINQCLYVDFNSYLVDNCLTKVDRSSMAVSLEVRVPLLDLDVVEHAFSIPGHHKMSWNESKSMLKKIAAQRIPPSCVYRTKQGFSIPIKQWLGDQFAPMMHELLDPTRIQQQGIFCAKTIDRMRKEHLSNVKNHSHTLWGLIMFQAWHDRWFKEATT